MDYIVIFAPEAEEQLVAIYQVIATAGSPSIAESYTNQIIEYCEGLRIFPYRGASREELRPGLRLRITKSGLLSPTKYLEVRCPLLASFTAARIMSQG
jgi:plasmid stabilization system protein ParE